MEDSPYFSLGLTQLDTSSVVGFVPGVFDYEEPNFAENRSKFRNNPNKMKEIRKFAAQKTKKAVGKSLRLSKKDDSGRPRLLKGMKYRIRKVPAHSLYFGSYCNRKFGEEINHFLGEEVLNLFRLYSMGGMPHVLNVWMYECCSEVDSTMAERLGNVIPRIFNWQVVEIKVKYEKFMVGMFIKFVYNNIQPTHEEVQSLNLQMIEGFQLKEAECGLSLEIAADCFDKRLAVGVQLQTDLDIEGFEEFSTVPPTEILKKAGLITDDSISHPSKKRKIVCFYSTTVEDQVCQKTTSFVSTRTVPTQKKASSGSERVYTKKTTPSSSLKSVCQDNSDEKWNDIKLILQSYAQVWEGSTVGEKSSQAQIDEMDIMQHVEDTQKGRKQEGEEKTENVNANEDVEDTEIFKTLKEKGKKIVGETNKSTDVYSTDDPMDGHYFDWNRSLIQQQSQDVEGCSEDNATASLDALVKSVVHYSSTLPESAQVELDAILKVIAAPVDEVPKEVVPQSESVVNQHNISNSQLPLDFSDSVVAAHQAAKPPAKIAKRIRTRSKVFKSPYTTEYASGSKAIEDQIEEQRHQFAFDGFLISDIISSGTIAEFKQWVEAELLKFHAKNDEHIDVIFYHLRKKSKLRNDQDYRFTTTNCFFKNSVDKTYFRYYEDDIDTVLSTQQDYAESVRVALIEEAVTHIIKGYCMTSGLPWHQVDEVYVLINCNDNFHWVLAVIALKDRRICVYDSLSRRTNTESILEIQKLAKMLSTFLSDNKFYDDTFRTDWPNLETYRDKITQTTQILNENPLDVEYVQDIMQQERDSVDCGVFVAGYAEFLSEEMNVPSHGFKAEYHRTHYATLLKKYGIQKAIKGYVSENDTLQGQSQELQKFQMKMK
ncbi:hypothetical protein P3S67_005484 [Capsicum chacoense]